MPNRLIFFSPIRGTDGTSLIGSQSDFDYLKNSAVTRSVPVTWMSRYDALLMSHYQTALAELVGLGHEVGLWLEPTPSHCAAAGVTYNTSGSEEFGAARCTLLGYSADEGSGKSDRQKLIDTIMAAYHAQFGVYPVTAGMWLLDTYSLNYMHEEYGVRGVPYCRNQKATDAYDLEGHPNNQLRECSSNWLAIPARGDSGRSGVVVCEPHTSDLANYFGSSGSSELFALEPGAIPRMYATYGTTVANYWPPVATEVLTNTTGAVSGNVISSLCENAYDPAASGSLGAPTNGQSIDDLFDAMNDLADGTNTVLSTFAEATAAFLTLSNSQRDQIKISNATQHIASLPNVRATEAFSPWKQTRITYQEGGTGTHPFFAISSLVPYSPSLVDPNNNAVLNQDLGSMIVGDTQWSSAYSVGGSGVVPSTQHDRPSDNAAVVRPIYFDPGTSTFYNFFSSTSGTDATSLTVTHLPSVDDPRLTCATQRSGTLEVVLRRRADLWTWKLDAHGAGASLLWVNDLLTSGTTGHPACTIFWKVGANPEQSASPAGGAFTDRTQVNNWDYLAITYTDGANAGTARLIVPVAGSLLNGTLTAFVPDDGTSLDAGVTSSASGQSGVQLAVITCPESEWRANLAEFLSDPDAFIGPDPAPTPPPTVATPVIAPVTGSYPGAQNATITCATDGATIHYTLDGSTPDIDSPVYSSAISVTSTTTIKAIGVKLANMDSAVATAVLTIDTTLPTLAIGPVAADGVTIPIVTSEPTTGTLGLSFKVAGSARGATVTREDSTHLTAVLDSVAYASQSVTRSYDPTTGNIVDAAGNEVASSSDVAVTNNSTQTPPSDETDTDFTFRAVKPGQQITAVGRQYLHFLVEATQDGEPVTARDFLVSIAFGSAAPGADLSALTWNDLEFVGPSRCKILVGQGGDAVIALTPGAYWVYLRATAGSEQEAQRLPDLLVVV